MIASNGTLSNPGNLTPPVQTSLFYVARYVTESVEFWLESGRAGQTLLLAEFLAE